MPKEKNQKFSWKPSKHFSGNKEDFSINNPFYDRMLSLSKSCRNWQLAFLIMALFEGGTLFGYFHLANKTKLVPYIVEVDKEKGSFYYTGRMDQINYTVDDTIIFAMLNDFVIDTRSVSLDKVFTYKKIKREYSFLSSEMKNKMNVDINNLKLEDKFKNKESIDVVITSMLRNSEDIYQVNWTEKTYKNGSLVSVDKKTGNFSVIQQDKMNPEDLKINPLGLIIQDYHITNDLSK